MKLFATVYSSIILSAFQQRSACCDSNSKQEVSVKDVLTQSYPERYHPKAAALLGPAVLSATNN